MSQVALERVPRTQATVRLRQSALPWSGEEHSAGHHAVRAVEPVDGTQTFDGSEGMSAFAICDPVSHRSHFASMAALR